MSAAARLTALLRPAFLLKALPLVIALALSAYLTFAYNHAISQGHAMMEHSMRAMTAMDEVLLRLEDAETGQRGYLITGEASYLAPYEKSRDAVPGALDALDALVNRNAAQHEAVERIRVIAARKLDELATTIRLHDSEGFEAARLAVLRDDGRADMNAIRSTVSEMKTREDAILSDASDSVSTKNHWIILVSAAALGISLLGRLISALIRLRGTFQSRA